jgi:hypothetical protein
MECKLPTQKILLFVLWRMDKMGYKFILIINCQIKITNSLHTLALLNLGVMKII